MADGMSYFGSAQTGCCYACDSREPGCHAKCPNYKEEQGERERISKNKIAYYEGIASDVESTRRHKHNRKSR